MSNNKKFSASARLGGNLLFYTSKVIGWLPWWFLYYVLAEAIYFLLYRVARYRIGVVRLNLETSFPEKDKKELRLIERRFYRNLSEYFIDAMEAASMSRRKWLKRAVYLRMDELARELDGRNWVNLMAHYGSWELFGSFAFHPGVGACVAAYRPLKNKAFDYYYYRIRNRFPEIGAVAMNELFRFYMTHAETGVNGMAMGVTLISDQHAPIDAQSQWVPFLNHTTVFFHGGEKIARKFNIPVYFMHVRKVRRGHYEAWYEQIWDGVSPTENHYITTRYATMLDAEIRQCPELWMWSHKRWKWQLYGDRLDEFNEKWGTDISSRKIY